MKNKLIYAIVFLNVITLVVACTPKKEEPAAAAFDKEKIKEEIQAKENEFAELYNSGELRNIGYYADDATVYAQHKPPLIGREAIIAFYKAGIDSSSIGNKITFTTHEVFVSNDANQVVETGFYNLVDSLGETLNRGNYMILFEKRDGKYVSVREMSASDMPLE